VLETFLLTHRPALTGGYNPHITSENLYWHSYYLYEIETQIRAMGPEFECFGMPYWDITNDGEYFANAALMPTAAGMPLYNSMLGGDGDPDDNYCVVDSPWSVSEYDTDYLCADDEEEGHCCLKRASGEWSDDVKLFTRAEVAEAVISPDYANFDAFGLKITDIHVNVHNFIGHEDGTHFNTDTGRPPADPLFVLFHCFLDYARVLHQDCYQFDKVNVNDLEDYMPYSYKTVYTDLDYVMRFGVLCKAEEEGLDVIVSPMCTETNVTVRDIYDSSPNTKWNVLYELGDFWNLNEPLLAECADNVNSTWFSGNHFVKTEGSNSASLGIVDRISGKMARFGARQYVFGAAVVLSAITVLIGLCLVTRCVRNRKYQRMDIMDLFLSEYVAV